jgi:hypothetical protein
MKNIKLYTVLGVFFFQSITSCFAMEEEFNSIQNSLTRIKLKVDQQYNELDNLINTCLDEKVPLSANPELEKKAIAAVNKYAQDKDTPPLDRNIGIGNNSLGVILHFDSETMKKGPLMWCSYGEWSNLKEKELQPYLSCLRWRDVGALLFKAHTPNKIN